MRTDESIERPLRGLRVIEFESIGPGLLTGHMLSELGARVTVVARPTPSPVDRTLIGENTENPPRQGKEYRAWGSSCGAPVKANFQRILCRSWPPCGQA